MSTRGRKKSNEWKILKSSELFLEDEKLLERVASQDRDTVSISMERLNEQKRQFDQLVTSVKNNEVARLTSINEDLVNLVDDNHGKSLLSSVCEGRNGFNHVTPATIQLLIKNKAKIDHFNTQWYGWEPLHYAAVAADEDKLKTICDALGKRKINTLTALSENALHILLAHGQQNETFSISRQNGEDLKMYKVIGEERDRVVACAELLVGAGVDVNHKNFWNETPILIALKRKYFRVVRLLLAVKDIELDSCKEFLKGKEAVIGLLPKPKDAKKDVRKILFQFLKSGDEESFLKYNGGNIREWANSLDGDNEENSSCSLLQYCFRRGLIACYQDMKSCEYENQFHYSDITANHLIQVFCRSGMVKCIQHLLDNGADINFTMRKFPEPLLQVATIKGYYPLISVILGRKNNVTSEMICDGILRLMMKTESDIDLDSTLCVALNRLLDPEQPVTVNETKTLMEVLNLGVKKINKENLRLLLKCPGSLSTKINYCNDTILEEIDPEVIQTHLDECVERKNGNICVNYESFIKEGSTKEVEKIFLKSPTLNIFLNHLVFKILINRKWEQLRICKSIKYFYLNLAFYVIFYALLNAYVLLVFHKVSNGWTTAIFALNSLCWIVMFLKELVQIAANKLMYLRDYNNFAEIFLIIVSFIVYVTSDQTAMVLTVLGSNLVLLLLLEQVPKLAKYIIILRTVVFYLRYILFYFIQFLAFAICFYILFSTQEGTFWENLGNKLYETILLFTGVFDYMKTNLEVGKNDFFSKTVIILFVLFMAVILHNLLLGLLVTDMSNLNRNVKLFEQMKRASFVIRLERFFVSNVGNFLPKVNSLIFDENFLIKINETDRRMLEDDEKQHLDFILAKKIKKQNVLKKLYSYINTKISERSTEKNSHGINKKMIEKLYLIEERIKNLHDVTEFIKNLIK